MASKKRTSQVKKAASGLTREALIIEAVTLAMALRALRNSYPKVTSDQLWNKILQHWTKETLHAALLAFDRKGDLTNFEKLIKPLPKADHEGFIEVEGEKWGSIVALEQKIDLEAQALMARIKASNCRTREGKARNGLHTTFYAVKDVEAICADIMAPMPRADKNGFFEAAGETWGSIKALARTLELGQLTVSSRIEVTQCRSRKGRAINGKITDFYALKDAQIACTNHRKRRKAFKPIGDNGRPVNKFWQKLPDIARRLKLGLKTVTARVNATSCRTRQEKISRRERITVYAFSDVKATCADLLYKNVKEKT